MIDKWDQRFLDLAKHVSSWSKDPSTKVGAVVADPKHHVLALGYNGFPRGADDSPHLYEDRYYKYKHIIHAEDNALRHVFDPPPGCSLYTYPFMPCFKCAQKALGAGIDRVVSLNNIPERWKEEFDQTQVYFANRGIELVLL